VDYDVGWRFVAAYDDAIVAGVRHGLRRAPETPVLEVEDLIQEARLQVAIRITRRRAGPIRKPRNWCYTVAAEVARKVTRKATRMQVRHVGLL